MTATDDTHALLGAGRVGLVLSQSVVNTLLLVHLIVHVDRFQFCYWLSTRKIVVVPFVYCFVLRPLAFLLTGFQHLGRVAAVIVDRGAASNWWESLLRIKFDIVHLKISFGCWSWHETSSNSSCIGD